MEVASLYSTTASDSLYVYELESDDDTLDYVVMDETTKPNYMKNDVTSIFSSSDTSKLDTDDE